MSDSDEIGGLGRAGYKAAIDLVCGAVDLYVQSSGYSQDVSDVALLELAKSIKMQPGGRAAQYLDHFIFGDGSAMKFDCATLIREDAGVRQRVRAQIERRLSEHPELAHRHMSGGDFVVSIRQGDYLNQDWRLALGSYAIEWEVVDSGGGGDGSEALQAQRMGSDLLDGGTLARTRNLSPLDRLLRPAAPRQVRIYGANEYKWHPAAARVTQCLHQAGDRLTRSRLGSKNFWMIARPCVIELASGMPQP